MEKKKFMVDKLKKKTISTWHYMIGRDILHMEEKNKR